MIILNCDMCGKQVTVPQGRELLSINCSSASYNNILNGIFPEGWGGIYFHGVMYEFCSKECGKEFIKIKEDCIQTVKSAMEKRRVAFEGNKDKGE